MTITIEQLLKTNMLGNTFEERYAVFEKLEKAASDEMIKRHFENDKNRVKRFTILGSKLVFRFGEIGNVQARVATEEETDVFLEIFERLI